MANQGGSVARVEIADGAQLFVITAGKGWAGVDAPCRVDDRAVQLEAELDESIRLIHFFRRQELLAGLAEYALSSGKEILILLAPPRYIQQSEQNARFVDSNGVVKVSRATLAGKDGCDLRVAQYGKRRRHRFDGKCRLCFSAFEQRLHGAPESGDGSTQDGCLSAEKQWPERAIPRICWQETFRLRTPVVRSRNESLPARHSPWSFPGPDAPGCAPHRSCRKSR